MDLWRHRFKDEPFVTYPIQWVGLYIEGLGGPGLGILVLRLLLPHTQPASPLPAHLGEMLYDGTYSRCLSKCEKHTCDMIGFFHLVKIIHTTRGRRKEKITFFYGKTATLGWDPDRWR